jgi:hypothetical protein
VDPGRIQSQVGFQVSSTVQELKSQLFLEDSSSDASSNAGSNAKLLEEKIFK